MRIVSDSSPSHTRTSTSGHERPNRTIDLVSEQPTAPRGNEAITLFAHKSELLEALEDRGRTLDGLHLPDWNADASAHAEHEVFDGRFAGAE